MRFLLFVFAASLFAACSPNNVTVDPSLKQYFDEQKADGCFALFDNGTGQFTIYNLARYRDSAFLPAATFDIVNALVGLQTGIIANDSAVLKTDSAQTGLNLYRAFRQSDAGYFVEAARRIGRDTMQHWLDSLSYGTKKIRTRIDSFWLDNSLKLTPDENLGVVKRLYFNQLPFFNAYQASIKAAMLREEKPQYRLWYKTAVGAKPDGTPLSWVVGLIEENQHLYFFVLNAESKNRATNLEEGSLTALKKILTQLNFFKGER